MLYDELAFKVSCKLWKKELDTARTASAAWKAKCKNYRGLYDIAVDEQCKGRDRVIAAEKRVAELEEVISFALSPPISCSCYRMLVPRGWTARAKAALNK